MCGSESRLDVSKGLVIGIIAAPLSLFGVGLAEGYAMSSLLKLGMPAFIFAATVAGALAFFAEKTAQVCLLVSRFLVGGFILLLAVAALENYFGFVLIPGMAPMGRQFELIGEISVMLAGAYPFVLFIQMHFAGLLHAFASFLKIDDSAALGMIVALVNPLPTYTLFDQMTRRGRVICSAFSGPALCLLGDQLGFVSAVYPAGISALFAGKRIAAVAALIMALALVEAG